MTSFADALRRAMGGKIGARKLSTLTGIPTGTIESWLQGRVERPRAWSPILIIAQALLLSHAETDTLLLSARHPPVQELAAQLALDHPDRRYVQPWLNAPPLLPSARHQLRAPVADFVGREAERERLVTALQSALAQGQGAIIGGVQGMGGIGKTELAYVIAQQVRSAFPDAQIVLALSGSSATPLPSEQALQTVLRAFLPDAKLPEELGALETLYRAQLDAKRVLILADDAHSAAQILPLLPPAGCALLITSRTRFMLPAMTTVDLDQLPDAKAVQLLRVMCPRLTDTEAEALARVCGYLPLALRISGSLLRSTPALVVDDYLICLADERQRLSHLCDPDNLQFSVEASLALSYRQLEPRAQAVFRQLGVLVGDFTTELVRAVVGAVAGVNVKAYLDHLLRRNLLMYDEARRRWRLHDLVRDLARCYLEATGELRATVWRYAQAAVHMAQTLHQQYLAGGDGVPASLAGFDAERPHIDVAWIWVTAHAGMVEGDRLLVALALATTHLGELRYDAERERIPRLEQAHRAAERLGQHQRAGWLLLSLGRACFDIGLFQRAIATWEQAFCIVREHEDRHSEGRILGNLGLVYARLGDLKRAIPAFEQALAIFQALGDRRRTGHALGNLGLAYHDDGKIERAIPFLAQALECTYAVGDRRFESMLLHTLSNVALVQGDLPTAVVRCEQALGIAREIGDRSREGYPLITLGCVYVVLGENAQATAAFETALTTLQAVEDRWGVAECHWHYGLFLAQQGERARALPLLRASVAYKQAIGHVQVIKYATLLAQLEAGEHVSTVLPRSLAQRTVAGNVQILHDMDGDLREEPNKLRGT